MVKFTHGYLSRKATYHKNVIDIKVITYMYSENTGCSFGKQNCINVRKIVLGIVMLQVGHVSTILTLLHSTVQKCRVGCLTIN